ncbi:MAG TPA: hypothetical protein VGK67_17550 [Myxococcales bacterium]|jgi:hypothetical protein
MTDHTRHRLACVTAALAATVFAAPRAGATPSTQIWIPSPDIQKFETLHLNYDVYARPGRIPTLMLGPTVGILPFDKIQAETGFDLIFQGNQDLDSNPLYFHGKLAVPEDAFFHWQPALAVGIYNVGIKRSDTVNTMQNVGYALLGRTLPILGRLSAGYYLGNAAVLRTNIVPGDPTQTQPDNHGLLLSWDRTLTELSDRLWVGVDYQQGQNFLGAINAGVSWAFTKDISVIVGYDHYWNQTMAGKDTFTVQLDVNLFMPKEKATDGPEGGSNAPGEKPADGTAKIPVPVQHASDDGDQAPADGKAKAKSKAKDPHHAGDDADPGETGDGKAKGKAKPASDAPAEEARVK